MEGIAKYSCKSCNFINNTSQLYMKHLKTDKHKKTILEEQEKEHVQEKEEKEQEKEEKEEEQEKKQEKEEKEQEKKQEKEQEKKQENKEYEKELKKQDEFICKKCMKEYKNNSGLWKHKKTCEFEKKDQDMELKNLIHNLHNTLLEEIIDIKKILLDKSKLL